MLYVVWALSVMGAFWLGYRFQLLTKEVGVLQDAVKAKVDKKPKPEEPQSTLIDLTDQVKEAQWEHDQMIKRLNPDE